MCLNRFLDTLLHIPKGHVPFASLIVSPSFSFLAPVDPGLGIVHMIEASFQKGEGSAGSSINSDIEQLAIH